MNNRDTLAVGTLFAEDFRLLGPLGQGGMGSVYLVEQLSTGQRRALKILHEQFASNPSMRARFNQEARITSRIHSAHVVQVISSGVEPLGGHPWICMEFLEGSTLDQRSPLGQPVPRGYLRTMMEQICHGLGAAHAEGIVHRDLKPENLFLARARLVGVPFLVKLLDFGIAKVLQEANPRGTMALGSPHWMAPEQFDGRHDISPATDVWALGLLAFRFFTGYPYWKALRGNNENPLAVFQELAAGRLVAPSERARELGVDIEFPVGFNDWFLRCTQFHPGKRFQDANVAVDAFRKIDGQASQATLPSVVAPSTGSPPTPPSRPRMIVLRHRQSRSAREVLEEYGNDLSIEGLWVKTKQPLPAGASVCIEILAGDLLVAQGTGVVRQVREDGMFVGFSGLSGSLVDELARRSRP